MCFQAVIKVAEFDTICNNCLKPKSIPNPMPFKYANFCELLLECIHIYSSKLVPHGFNAFNFIYLVLYLVSWEGWSSLCFSFTFKIIVFNRLCPNLYLLISEMIKYQCSTAYYIRLTTIPAGSLATHLTYLEKSGFTSIYTSLWKAPQRKYVKIFF